MINKTTQAIREGQSKIRAACNSVHSSVLKLSARCPDKQVIDKTTQALREGQSKIRQLLHLKNEVEVADTSEKYLAYSVTKNAAEMALDQFPMASSMSKDNEYSHSDHHMPSEISCGASHPKGCRRSFNSITTSNSHQNMFEAEQQFYGLDFTDETTIFDEVVLHGNVLEPIIESNSITSETEDVDDDDSFNDIWNSPTS